MSRSTASPSRCVCGHSRRRRGVGGRGRSRSGRLRTLAGGRRVMTERAARELDSSRPADGGHERGRDRADRARVRPGRAEGSGAGGSPRPERRGLDAGLPCRMPDDSTGALPLRGASFSTRKVIRHTSSRCCGSSPAMPTARFGSRYPAMAA
jgi:hypothetical protein